jgi:diguanylate cyclase (GGDEF)-like protein
LRCVGLLRDVSDAKRAHERLLHDAVHCSLTGLPNRELLLDRLKCAIARAKTDNGVKPALIFIDLDKFKSVNSSFGLVRGDSLLLTVARRLQRHLGPHDTVARVGGDQFAMLFIGEREARNLPALAERVRRSLRAPIPLANQEVILTGSMGVAVWDGTQAAEGDLLKNAELAMYRAKQSGSDRIEVFEPGMRRDRDSQVEVENDLRKAIEKGQLKVLYQPVVYLPTKELAGFEALVRWEHPKLGLVNPFSLMASTDDIELLIKLSSYVLLRAAKDAVRWLTELPRAERPLFVAVNVSGPQLLRAESVQEIRHILGRNIAPPGTLRLEISESLVMDNPEQAAEVLKVLHGSGVQLALDDFGTGYSSLAYLNRFPLDTIKIDRELVRGSGTAAGAAIMRSMVALAHELSKTVAAEGVERADQATFLRSIGCEFAQGYHFGEPIPDRAVSQLLKMVRRSERKMQPRGFFRPTQKSAAKGPAKKAPRTVPQPQRAASAEQKPAPLQISSSAGSKPATLPAGSVIRQRHNKAGDGRGSGNGAAKPTAASLNGQAKRTTDVQLREAVAGGVPTPPPTLLPLIQQPAGIQAPHPGEPVASRPEPFPGLLANGPGLAAVPPSLPKPVPERTLDAFRPNIISPLAEALARAANNPAPSLAPLSGPPPPAPPAHPTPRNSVPPPPVGPPPPMPANGASPAPPSAPQPDFSTLPPSIAASLARLAGNVPAAPSTADAKSDTQEPKTVSKVGSSGA